MKHWRPLLFVIIAVIWISWGVNSFKSHLDPVQTNKSNKALAQKQLEAVIKSNAFPNLSSLHKLGNAKFSHQYDCKMSDSAPNGGFITAKYKSSEVVAIPTVSNEVASAFRKAGWKVDREPSSSTDWVFHVSRNTPQGAVQGDMDVDSASRLGTRVGVAVWATKDVCTAKK